MQTRPIEAFKGGMLVYQDRRMARVIKVRADGVVVMDVLNGGWRMFFNPNQSTFRFEGGDSD